MLRIEPGAAGSKGKCANQCAMLTHKLARMFPTLETTLEIRLRLFSEARKLWISRMRRTGGARLHKNVKNFDTTWSQRAPRQHGTTTNGQTTTGLQTIGPLTTGHSGTVLATCHRSSFNWPIDSWSNDSWCTDNWPCDKRSTDNCSSDNWISGNLSNDNWP